jgi:uncharacterized repeat protein (TIGR01451 family)
MFSACWNFDQPLNIWNTSSATDLSGMFSSSGFNQPLSDWDLSNVTDISWMFYSTSFNQDISLWDVSNVISMMYCFQQSRAFNQNLSSWAFNNSMNLSGMLSLSGLDTTNYDALLVRFLELNMTNTSQFSNRNLLYCDSFTRNALINSGLTLVGDSLSPNCDQNVTGKIRFDQNNDGCNDADLLINALPVGISSRNYSLDLFTANGDFEISLPHGTYNVTPVLNSGAFAVTPTSSTITITNELQSFVNNFCLTPISNLDDLEITLLPLEDARPGFETTYKLIYQNNGNTVLSGDIEFNYDDNLMALFNAVPSVNTFSGRSLYWSFSNLNPFEVREILVTFTLNTPTDVNFPLNGGDSLGLFTEISHAGIEITPPNNRASIKHEVVNSFDPNDKSCLQGNTITPEDIGEFLHYRIRFENEGTASAVNVRIVDFIDLAKFDISTLVPLSASHSYKAQLSQANKLEFIFDNILLPFTAPASQGYVLFKIKTVDTLVLGDDFSNQAEIYFDFNFPIITNLETTSVDATASIKDTARQEVHLFPNPAINAATITSNIAFSEWTVYNTLGSVVSHKKLTDPEFILAIEVSNLTSGLYFIELKNTSGSTIVKMLKD